MQETASANEELLLGGNTVVMRPMCWDWKASRVGDEAIVFLRTGRATLIQTFVDGSFNARAVCRGDWEEFLVHVEDCDDDGFVVSIASKMHGVYLSSTAKDEIVTVQSEEKAASARWRIKENADGKSVSFENAAGSVLSIVEDGEVACKAPSGEKGQAFNLWLARGEQSKMMDTWFDAAAGLLDSTETCIATLKKLHPTMEDPEVRDQRRAPYMTALMHACKAQKVELVKCLLELGLDLKTTDECEYNAIMWSMTDNERTDLARWLLATHSGALDLVNLRTGWGGNMVHFCSFFANVDALRMVVLMGVDIDYLAKNSRTTALEELLSCSDTFEVEKREGREKCIEFLQNEAPDLVRTRKEKKMVRELARHSIADVEEPLQRKKIMLSYNWDHQDMIKKIKDALTDAGFDVWIDIEQMSGSTLAGMAAAVENADVVCIAMSQAYQDSKNCRLEGEYAMQQQKVIVPFMMQAKWRPSGWLGLTLGSKLWFSFTEEGRFAQSFDQLLSELSVHFGGSPSKPPISTTSSSTSSPPAKEERKFATWSGQAVHDWLLETPAKELAKTFLENEVDGICLVELQSLYRNLPELYFKTILPSLGLPTSRMALALKFTHLVNQLS